MSLLAGSAKLPKTILSPDEQINADHVFDLREGILQQNSRSSVSGANLSDNSRAIHREKVQQLDHLGTNLKQMKHSRAEHNQLIRGAALT